MEDGWENEGEAGSFVGLGLWLLVAVCGRGINKC